MNKGKTGKILNYVFILILFLYPLRHIAQGIDFNDTGYSYANFEYMGLEHMDSMWLYSTYLANVVGHFLTKLPFAISLIGMNFYTGLFVSGAGVGSFFFCEKNLKMPGWIVFVGEMQALNLCWCPTADLYNYLTYLFMLGCVMLLYCGLTDKHNREIPERKVPDREVSGRNGAVRGDVTLSGLGKKGNRLLFLAGICLGCNVLVRFSNLPEMAFIVAVWAYGVLEWIEDRKSKAFRHTIYRTLLCMAGYLTALFLLFGYIHIRYGISDYIAGIRRLFDMTENAVDYKPKAMVAGMLGDYIDALYYVARIGAFLLIAMILYYLLNHILIKKGVIAKISSFIMAGVMVFWLCTKTRYTSFQYRSYDPIWWPAILFLMLAMIMALVRIFDPRVKKEEKLLGGMLIITIIITSLGSNNRTYPSINNMFLVAPYLYWQIWKLTGTEGQRISTFPVKSVLGVLLLTVWVQAFGFGLCFVFAESTGAQDMTEVMDREGVLKRVRMSPEKAEIMRELLDYVEENGLKGADTILYGDIPALSFYLQLPAAFNPWCNLTSYSVETFEGALARTQEKMLPNGGYRPVVLLEEMYASCLEALYQNGYDLKTTDYVQVLQILYGDRAESVTPREVTAAQKFVSLLEFIDENGYEIKLRNEKTALLY